MYDKGINFCKCPFINYYYENEVKRNGIGNEEDIKNLTN